MQGVKHGDDRSHEHLKRSLWALSSTSPVTLGEFSLTGLQLLYVFSGGRPLYSVRLLTVVEFGLVAEQAVPSVLSLLSSIWLPKLVKSQLSLRGWSPTPPPCTEVGTAALSLDQLGALKRSFFPQAQRTIGGDIHHWSHTMKSHNSVLLLF